jgi:hypothetical protein
VYLAALGDFELLRHLFGKIAIPQAVFEEVVAMESGSRTVWPSNASSLRRFVPGSTTFEGPDFGYATNTIASSLRALANSAILN